jgi:hypothetical protein
LITVPHQQKWPAEFGRPFYQTLILQRLRERATGLEPVTSSLGSGRKTTRVVRKSLILLTYSSSQIQYAPRP